MRILCLTLCILSVFPKVHMYRSNPGAVRDLSCLTNEDCESVKGIDNTILSYMRLYDIPGAQLAVMRGDSLLYARGYGYSDRAKKTPMQPYNILRIASVSKLVTAVGIMKLCDEGRLHLDDTVFGPGGILGNEEYALHIRDPRCCRITVEHLLRHQGGFSSRRGDPMFGRDVTSSGVQLLEKTLSRRLGFSPGTSQDYSNTGYFILSLIIEKLTGQSYESWMRANVLEPCHCFNFEIAGNLPLERHPDESHYYMQPGAEPDMCYRVNNVTRLSGAGAWTASAAELCRLVSAIDNDARVKDILSWSSIDRMTQYIRPEVYSLGWSDTSSKGVWTRTGSFVGTTAIIKYFSETGDCWVLITNSSTCYGAMMGKRNSNLIRRLRNRYLSQLPKHDLFY